MYHWKEGSKIKATYLQSLQKLADTGQLKPILERVYESHCIVQALSHVTNSKNIGSTVIKF
jgi:NADPH:quinone reductase-like Zn-dependent oxidoreductase